MVISDNPSELVRQELQEKIMMLDKSFRALLPDSLKPKYENILDTVSVINQNTPYMLEVGKLESIKERSRAYLTMLSLQGIIYTEGMREHYKVMMPRNAPQGTTQMIWGSIQRVNVLKRDVYNTFKGYTQMLAQEKGKNPQVILKETKMVMFPYISDVLVARPQEWQKYYAGWSNYIRKSPTPSIINNLGIGEEMNSIIGSWETMMLANLSPDEESKYSIANLFRKKQILVR